MDRQITITLTEGGELTGDMRMLSSISHAFLIESEKLHAEGHYFLSREARIRSNEIYNALDAEGFYDEAKKRIAEDIKNRKEEE